LFYSIFVLSLSFHCGGAQYRSIVESRTTITTRGTTCTVTPSITFTCALVEIFGIDSYNMGRPLQVYRSMAVVCPVIQSTGVTYQGTIWSSSP
jgi:hypothetical protein